MATYGKPQSTVLDRTVQTGHVAIGEARKHFHRTTMCAMALSRYSLRWIIVRAVWSAAWVPAPASGVAGFPQEDQPRNAQAPSTALDRRQLHDSQIPQVKAWLEKHECFHMHFTPTSSWWMSMIERFFKPLRTNLRFQTLLHACLRHRAWSRGGCFHCEK